MGEMSGGRILGIGELLWDLFPDGARLGGAPFNVVANLRRLGHPAAFVTAVGDDDLGRRALTAADELGVEATFVSVALDLPTGTVDVTPDGGVGHRFAIRSRAAYESVGDGDALIAKLAGWRPDALVFGTLAQRAAGVRDLTRRVATEIRPAHRMYDVNLRDGCWTPGLVLDLLADATLVKVNESESDVLADLLGVTSSGSARATALGSELASRSGVCAVCITRGADGATLWIDGEEHGVAGIPTRVADTVGAGDAFAAGLLHGLLAGAPAAETLASANRLASLVASRPGAIPPWTLEDLSRR